MFNLFSAAYVLCLIALPIIGVIIFLKDVRSSVNRSFFLTMLAATAWIFAIFVSFYFIPGNLDVALLFLRLAYGSSILLIFSICAFFYYFPERLFKIPVWVSWSILFFTLLLTGISIFTPLVEQSIYIKGNVQFDVFGPLYWMYLLYFVMGLSVALFFSVKQVVSSYGLARLRILYVCAGFLLSALLAVLTNVVLPVFNIYVLQKESGLFPIFFFVATFYSIYRQRFFRLDYIALHLLRNLIIFSIFIFSVILVDRLVSPIFDSVSPDLVFVIGGVAAFVFYGLFSGVFPNFYSAQFRSLKKNVAELEGKLLNIKTYQELVDLIENVFVEKIGLKKAAVYVVEGERLKEGVLRYESNEFTAFLEKRDDILLMQEMLMRKEHKKTIVFKEMKSMGAAVCLPLLVEKKIIGFLILGEKRRNVPFTAEEIKELILIRPTMEVSLMNFLITSTLREENNIMRKIVKERTRNLTENNQKLEKMVKQQENFISLTAHEFRTPLTISKLGLERILYFHKGSLPKEFVEDIKTSHDQLNKLAELISRLLELRQLELQKLTVANEKIDLLQFIEGIVKGIRLLSSKEGISVEFLRPDMKSLFIITDKVKLQQVFDNILQNACKFTRKGGKIIVGVSSDMKKKRVNISIEDNGAGMPPRDLKIIFDKFQQGSRYSQGIGIGLYLCKKYMQILKGDISVKSKLKKGTCFTLSLPIEV